MAQAAAFLIEGDEVASSPTAQWGPGKHHLWCGGPEDGREVHPVHGTRCAAALLLERRAGVRVAPARGGEPAARGRTVRKGKAGWAAAGPTLPVPRAPPSGVGSVWVCKHGPKVFVPAPRLMGDLGPTHTHDLFLNSFDLAVDKT